MNERNPTLTHSFPPFGHRASGLLLHVTCLPSRYGIGDLGPGAYAWIDRLHETGQTWWQALPFGPTGFGNSPYQNLSSFLGNGLFVSPELLIEDGLLQVTDCSGAFSPLTVDYDVVIPFKHRLLETVWTRFKAGVRKDLIAAYDEFRQSRSRWLDDYALFRALKLRFKGASYLDWPTELAKRVPSALVEARRSLANEVDMVCLAQFLLFRQGKRLKEYARARGIRLIGDLPFFVSPDSSDVWANPELFVLDAQYRPRFVGGVPPDYFSSTGQLWGNPVYDWQAHRDTDYGWWIDRLITLLDHVDVIRLDHFRAFAAAWHIPAGSKTAKAGEWIPGPGFEFFDAVRAKLGALPFIAENLGLITPDVSDLRDRFSIPSTRVLQFAFDGNLQNPHLPENYSANTVVYTGTHDNATTREWFEQLSEPEQRYFWRYLGRSPAGNAAVAREMILLAWRSPAAIAIAPLQDLLNLGSAGRMNVPGEPEGNWRWRANWDMFASRSFEWLSELTDSADRKARVLVDATRLHDESHTTIA
jgi:4-alpha-glucanotransferase